MECYPKIIALAICLISFFYLILLWVFTMDRKYIDCECGRGEARYILVVNGEETYVCAACFSDFEREIKKDSVRVKRELK